jgi:integrase
MPRKSPPLTDAKIRNAAPKDAPYKLTDGGGLYLWVSKDGSKLWRLDYAINEKRKTLSFGRYPEFGLAAARAKREEAREMIASGIDPAEKRKEEKQEISKAKAAAQNSAAGLPVAGTFEAVAWEWFEAKISTKSESHRSRAAAYLKNDLMPYLGKVPIAEIKAPALLECLRRIAERKNNKGAPVTETANRVREQMGQLWRYAIATGQAERDIAADLRGALQPHTQKNYAHIDDPKLLGQLMRDIDGYRGVPVTLAALKVLPMVFVRPGELRQARWADIHFESKEWRYHSSKTDIDHIVPLAEQVIAILRQLEPLTGAGEYVFGVRSGHRPMSEATINQALKTLGYGGDVIQPHGFRHTAATMLAEMGWDENTIDRQLSHLAQGVKGVYQKAKYIEDRRKMMQAWADRLDQLKQGAEIIPFRSAS